MSDQPTAGPFTAEQEARIRDMMREALISAGVMYPAYIVDPKDIPEVATGGLGRASVDAYFDRLVAPERVIPRPPRQRSKCERFVGWLRRIATASCPSFIPSLPTDYAPARLEPKLFTQEEADRYAEFQLKPLGLWAGDDQTSPQSEQSPSARRNGHAQ